MGHLFILPGNLTRLHCDAFLLPTDRRLELTPGWRADLPPVAMASPPDWPHVRTAPWPGWPSDRPLPWLTKVGARGKETRWYVEGALEFVRQAAASRPRHTDRERPLLALPLVGTGSGGAANDKGGIVCELVPALLREVASLDVDLALVLDRPPSFAACQLERKKHASWAQLSGPLQQQARRLAELARCQELAFFLGAGVSKGAGLPDWRQLLDQLAHGQIDDALYQAMDDMSLLDKAQLLFKRQGADLRRKVAERIAQGQHYSLCHGLLAGIPHREAVTQNYDGLYERACEAAGQPLSILPYRPLPGRRWLLKMHGCVEHPEDIVLSREDFLRYAKTRGALAGLVQGLLLTRHLVFVGFSLTDDNFLIIMDEVRRARNASTKMGSALLLGLKEPLRQLWQDELDLIALDSPGHLELFLDFLLCEATSNTHHLLDSSYHKLLSHHEQWLKAQLLQLRDQATPDVRSLPAWSNVQNLLEQLGDHEGPVAGHYGL